MKQRHPNTHRQTAANELRTQKQVEKYYGKLDLLLSWEKAPQEMQIEHHDYIIELRRVVRNHRNYLLHRADAKVKV